jgi:hypothetical protein
MGEDNLRKMAENDVLWIPNVVRARNGLDGAGPGGAVCCVSPTAMRHRENRTPAHRLSGKKMLAEQLARLRFARKLGVTTAEEGTGVGSVGILHEEAMILLLVLTAAAGNTGWHNMKNALTFRYYFFISSVHISGALKTSLIGNPV